MIDEKGRIFGVVNIIDAFIVLVIVGIVAFGMRLASSKGIVVNTAAARDTVIITYFSEESPSYVADVLNIGDPLEDESKVIGLGTVTDITVDKGFAYSPSADGQLVKSFKEGYSSIEIVSEAKGQIFPFGVMVDGNKYSIGHSLTLRVGYAKVFVRVKSIELKGTDA